MAGTTAAPSGADFAATFDTRYDPSTGLRRGGTHDRLRDRLVREEHARLARQGFQPWTVLNLLPFALSVDLGELGRFEAPAATPEAPGRRTIARYRLSMRDLGDGNFTPVSVLPAELAKEFAREYAETGGVVIFEGTGEPEAARLAEARARVTAYWRREFQKAIDSWSRYHQHKFVTDRQRDAARALYAAGEIAALPEWVTATRAQASLKACPDCGEDVKTAALKCRYCGYRFGAALEGSAEGAAGSLGVSEADIEDEPASPRARRAR